MVINSSNVILDVYNGAVCSMRYPAETHLKLKSRKVSFTHNLFRTCPIGLVFRTEHGSDTAVLCAEFQNDWTNEMDVMDGGDSSSIAQLPLGL